MKAPWLCPVVTRSPRWLWCIPVLASTLLAAPPIQAQSIEDEFSVQRFHPAPRPRNFFATRGARTDGEMAFSAGLLLDYAYEPFVLRSCVAVDNCDDPTAGRSDIKVVENMVSGHVMGSLTPIPMLQIGLRVPVMWVKG